MFWPGDFRSLWLFWMVAADGSRYSWGCLAFNWCQVYCSKNKQMPLKVYGTAFCSAGILTNLRWVCFLVKGRTLCVVLLKESLRKFSVSLSLNITRSVVRNRPGNAGKSILSSTLQTPLWREVQPIAIRNALPPAVLASPLCQILGRWSKICLSRSVFSSIWKEESCKVVFLMWLASARCFAQHTPASVSNIQTEAQELLLYVGFSLSFCVKQPPNQISVSLCAEPHSLWVQNVRSCTIY